MSLRSFFKIPSHLSGPDVTRTTTSNQNPLIYRDTQDRDFFTGFYTPVPPGAWLGKQTWTKTEPGKVAKEGEEDSYWYPPPHYHLLQDEHFKVDAGEAIFTLYGGKQVRLKKGEEILIPARRSHTFHQAEDSEEPLSVLFRYDTEYAVMEERFFRNVFSYFEDCRKAGVEPSLFQTCVFVMHGWMAISLPEVGPEWFNLMVSVIATVVLGCIGQFILGYKVSYSEYYKESGKKEN